MHSTNISPWLVWQSQRMKIRIEPSTPRDQLNREPTNLPLKEKPRTHQWIVIMEGGDEDMEIDVITQRDDKLIRTESD